jgi:hypothetical protein
MGPRPSHCLPTPLRRAWSRPVPAAPPSLCCLLRLRSSGSGGVLTRPHARLAARPSCSPAMARPPPCPVAPRQPPRARARQRLGWPNAEALALLPGSSAAACSRTLTGHGTADFSSGGGAAAARTREPESGRGSRRRATSCWSSLPPPWWHEGPVCQ